MWIKGLVGQGFGGSGGSERVMGECLVGQWIVGVISFQKIFGLYGLKHHIVEISGAVSSDLYRHYFCGNFLNFPFLFSFHMNLCCTWVAYDGKNCRQAWNFFLPILY